MGSPIKLLLLNRRKKYETSSSFFGLNTNLLGVNRTS